jgi:hypothetical protein
LQDKNEKQNMRLTKEKALQIIRKHLMQKVLRNIEIQDGLPKGCILYSVPSDEPCWTVRIPPEQLRTGPSHIICISKNTGRIIYDGFTNEE